MIYLIRFKLYKIHQRLSSELRKIYKYIIYKILKIKKPYKMAIVYISEKYNQIIIVPYYFNKDGINYEQEMCYLYDINIDDETLGIEIINALNKFEYNDKKYIINYKLTDGPAFRYSKLKTIKLFKEYYKYILIDEEKGYMQFHIEYPPNNKNGYGMKISEIQNNAKNCDIGKKIKEIYTI
jgi:hypothetical protein